MIVRSLLFVAAMVLLALTGRHWTAFLYLAAGILCFPAVPLRALYQQLRVKEWLVTLLALALILTGVAVRPPALPQSEPAPQSRLSGAVEDPDAFLAALPEYGGAPFLAVNGNKPFFDSGEIDADSFERYGALDALGRCTVCEACVGQDLMPTSPRESIYEVKPTGWHSIRYDFIDGESLYNRCHLIGFQLTAENANPNNLITGTRYLNTEGMLPFENEIGDYVRSTGNHVLYRVTPLFLGTELVARGVLMEAVSLEDGGAGVCFCVFCYNVQPGVSIDYATGSAVLTWEAAA